ncbi:hypothetical protein EIN_065230 [Entamoeba invadens IP1]|uniref:Uncharacterized protein n=1 Tax=Entamoeba invadens IP1 TaxID=370355 RepID=A0A0A1U050_ENTIV|nr:hypothetical protein EIN_065230 [Entamoeba invadens IP1]ELP84268.1 hypothetical protein EIN_065230 [Entamoeba invadens IP1]|eukprot:XP_004183614.1 hypothetical protein EIN_065230 [Entamoeba invadens IP1]
MEIFARYVDVLLEEIKTGNWSEFREIKKMLETGDLFMSRIIKRLKAQVYLRFHQLSHSANMLHARRYINYDEGTVDEQAFRENDNHIFYMELVDLFYCPDEMAKTSDIPSYILKDNKILNESFEIEITTLAEYMWQRTQKEIDEMYKNVKESKCELHRKMRRTTGYPLRLSLLNIYNILESLNLVNLMSVVHILVCVDPTTVGIERFFSKLRQMQAQNMLLKTAYERPYYCLDNDVCYLTF